MLKLSNKEYLIMRTLWDHDQPLTAAQLDELLSGNGVSRNSIYLHINGLMKKGLVEVIGKTIEKTSPSRQFIPVITEADYVAIQFSDNLNTRATPENLKVLLVSALKSEMVDDETWGLLQELLDERNQDQ